MDGKRELELTPELLEFAKACALQEARKYCPRWIDFDDVVGDVQLRLLKDPPKYDPSKGASVKTLLHTVVRRLVLKYASREKLRGERFMQVAERETAGEQEEEETPRDDFPVELGRGRDRKKTVNRRVALLDKSSATDDVLQFIDNSETQALCRLVIECGGNVSEAARRLGLSEGTVRYRLRLLAPKLRAAGFHPVEGMTWEDEEE